MQKNVGSRKLETHWPEPSKSAASTLELESKKADDAREINGDAHQPY